MSIRGLVEGYEWPESFTCRRNATRDEVGGMAHREENGTT